MLYSRQRYYTKTALFNYQLNKGDKMFFFSGKDFIIIVLQKQNLKSIMKSIANSLS